MSAAYHSPDNLHGAAAVDFIASHLRQELDFLQEACNATTTAEFIAAEPRLNGRVHIPKVYQEYSTKRVLTAEWIDGVRLSDHPGIRKLMGERTTSSPTIELPPSLEGISLKGGFRAIMQTMVELFSAQMFNWGWVHCDPHPGNIIVRPHPQDRSQPQLVLLDHGLYVKVGADFRRQYAGLWRALLAADWDTIESTTRSWGIGSPDLFASITLMRPIRFKLKREDPIDTENEVNQYERGVRMKERLKGFLSDTEKLPKELIFLGRNMRIVQGMNHCLLTFLAFTLLLGNNQVLGSPVNRIKITGHWASRSLTTSANLTLNQRLREYWHDIAFRVVMLSIDLAFWMSKARQWIRMFFGKTGEGFEDEIERSMRDFAKSALGVDVAPGIFVG